MAKVTMRSSFPGSKRAIERGILKDVNERRALQIAQARQGANHADAIEEKPHGRFPSRASPEEVYANPYIWKRR